jgi:hypothetical protein
MCLNISLHSTHNPQQLQQRVQHFKSFESLFIQYYMSRLLCTSSQAPYGSILFASCNRFQSQFGSCDAMMFLILLEESWMCMVTQITCANSAEFCKDETLRLLAEQRRSNMEVWTVQHVAHLRTDRMHMHRIWTIQPSVAYPDRATQTFWTPTCTEVASHTTVPSGRALQRCSRFSDGVIPLDF